MMPKPTINTPVFVYGTLKRGGPWNHLLKDAEFMGTAQTANRYPMIIDSIPYLLDEDAGHQVEGELFNVPSYVMLALDALEQHPRWYIRKWKPVVLHGQQTNAYIYFLTKDCYQDIPDWRRAAHHVVYAV